MGTPNLPTLLLTATALLSGCGDSDATSDVLASTAAPTHYDATRESLDTHPLPQWWKDGKFGIFIHWGVYSVPAYAPTGFPIISTGVAAPPGCTPYAEWYWFWQQVPGCLDWVHHLQTYGASFLYDDFIPQFGAGRYDPDAWIELFEDAGAKYFVLTSKHHDGYALWPTGTTHRNSMDLSPHRDLLGELFDAAHRAGDRVKAGVYYSIPEWHNPAHRPADVYLGAVDPTGLVIGVAYTIAFGSIFPPRNAYTQLPVPYTGYVPIDDYAAGQVRPQIKELVDRYHPNVLWCDIGGKETYFKSNETIAYFYNQSLLSNPEGVVVDDRCGDGTTRRDYGTVEYGSGNATPPFEATRGMGLSFGYNAEETEADYLSAAALIQTLIDSVAKGGNLLLNIGPKADGTIPDLMSTRLRAIGAWLRINGEAIYGSSPWTQVNDGSSTYFTVGKDAALYILSTVWPGQTLTVNAPVPVTASSRIVLLGSDGAPLQYTTNGSSLVITMPAGGDQRVATVSEHAFVFRVTQ